MKHLVLSLVIIFLAVTVCEAQSRGKVRSRNAERTMVGKYKKVHSKEAKVKESRKIRKAKEEQAKKEDKLKKEYNDYVSESKKRAFKIQTPDVQERMKQNQKEIKEREKNKKKRSSVTTKRAQKKYKK